MATKKNDHMGDMSGMPKMPMQTYKFDKALDQKTQAQFEPIFDTEGRRVVMPGVHKARMKAQMNKRKGMGM